MSGCREEEIGTVTDFFARPVVAGIELSQGLKVGDRIHVKGHTTDLELDVESMHVDNAAVNEASTGQRIGIKVSDRVRPGTGSTSWWTSRSPRP